MLRYIAMGVVAFFATWGVVAAVGYITDYYLKIRGIKVIFTVTAYKLKEGIQIQTAIKGKFILPMVWAVADGLMVVSKKLMKQVKEQLPAGTVFPGDEVK